MRLLRPCPLCSKTLELRESVSLGAETLNIYKCGHSFVEEKAAVAYADVEFSCVNGSGKSAREYQKDGVLAALEAEGNFINGDQMRLGKTPQGLLTWRYLRKKGKKKCLIVVRAANLWQWIREYKTWADLSMFGIYPIVGTKSFIPPGFGAYIISMDTFGRNGMSDRLLKEGFDHCIVDEAHSFKNVDAQRTQALIAFLKEVNKAEITHEIKFQCAMCKNEWTETVTVTIDTSDNVQRVHKRSFCKNCDAVVTQTQAAHVKVTRKCSVNMLSGTSIKNRADELFVPLNILAPDKVTSISQFRRSWLEQDEKGKWSRINRHRYDQFKEFLKPYFLRREKEDVYTDLPEINRTYTIVEIESGELKDLYNRTLDLLEVKMSRSDFRIFDSIGDLMTLRRICGIAKCKFAKAYAEELLEDSDNAKLAIGIHHHSVRDALAMQLQSFGTMRLSGEDSPERKDQIMTSFEHAPEKILIINMLAGGVGMDFHYVNNVLILERQWSAADEEQFEFRFYNPDKSIKNVSTNVEYAIAKDTVDEFFHDLVEEKRVIFGETLGTNWNLQSDQESFRSLLEKTVRGRL
jgi:SNF2 family DNA or RNA helicase